MYASLMTNWLSRLLGSNPSKRYHPTQQSCLPAQFEILEERVVLDASLPDLSAASFIGGQDLYVALPGTDTEGSSIAYTASSSSASVSATVVTGNRSIKMTVSGVDGNGEAFSGELTFMLFEDVAPETTARIISLIQSGFYEGLDFHRILDGFVAQGGDPDGDGTGGSGTKLDDEFSSHVTFTSEGLLAMANSGDDTSDSQFFVTDTDLTLDSMPRSLNFNYTIFGVLTSGFDTFQELMSTPVVSSSSGEVSSPVNPVVMTNLEVFNDTTNGVVKVSAASGFTGSSTITIKGTGSGTAATDSFIVTGVSDTLNDPPYLGPISDQSTAVNTPISFTVTGIDLKSDSLTFVVKDPTSASSNSTALSSASSPLHGTVTITTTPASGSTPASALVTFTPETGFIGTVEMLVGVRDSTTHSGASSLDASNNYDTQVISMTVTSEVTNVPPVANAGGPYTIVEGESLTLDASGSSDADGDTLTYSWDINGDGTFGDATGVNPTLTKSQLTSLGITNETASFNVTVRVDDGKGHIVSSAATTFEFNNAPPVATITGPTSGTPDEELTFTLGATDASSSDNTAGFTWKIDWDGDGTFDQEVTGTSTQTVTHTFTAGGPANVKVKAIDQDGGESEIVTLQVNIEGVNLVDGTLNIVGSEIDDVIKIIRDSETGQVHLFMNFEDQGLFDVTNGIHIEGGAGDDRILIWSDVATPATINGGDGNDLLKGGKGDDVIHGGSGDDTIVGRSGEDQLFGDEDYNTIRGGGGDDLIVGGSSPDDLRGGDGRDVIIGGGSADLISGGSRGDLMIGGTTDYDTDEASLGLIREAWLQDLNLDDRITLLEETGVGDDNSIVLDVNADDSTVQDDSANDKVFSSLGRSWYIGARTDIFSDPNHGLVKSLLDE